MKHQSVSTSSQRLGRATGPIVAVVLTIVAFAAGKFSSGPNAIEATVTPSDAVEPAAVKNPIPVETVRLSRSNSFSVTREYVGRVESARSSRLAFERPGRVEAVLFDDGQSVSVRQPIARLDTALLKAQEAVAIARRDAEKAVLDELVAGPREEQKDVANADLAQLKADYALAQITAGRQRRLFESGSSPEQRYDEARLALTSLAARVKAAEARVAELDNGTRIEQVTAQTASYERAKAEVASIGVDLAKAVLLAPFSGQIVSRMVDEGEVVTAGTPVVHLIENSQLEIRVGLPGDVADSLQPDDEVTVKIGEDSHKATVARIVSQRADGVRTVDVILKLTPDENGQAVAGRDGDTATFVRQRTIPGEGFWLPIDALVEGVRGLWSCYAIRDDESGNLVVERMPIEVIHTTQAAVYVDGPIRHGDQIVVSGVHRLVPSQRVSIAAERATESLDQ